MLKARQKVELVIFSIIIVLFYIWFAWPAIVVDSESVRLIEAAGIDGDEARHLHLIRDAVR